MNSKGIEPRVGMQVENIFEARIVGIDKDGTIRMVNSEGRPFEQEPASSPFGSWYAGVWKILWIPPTDEERALFREAAEHFSGTADGTRCRDFAYCQDSDSAFVLSGHWSKHAVIDSLALDGADYDNMPEGYV